MNKYETVILLKETLTEDNKTEVIKKFEDYISKNGNLISTENLGSKKMAYEIKKQKTAHYYIINFKTKAENITELERLYRITDEILKFIVVRRDD